MPTILYAEDDRDCRELYAFVLRQNDYTVFEANNGAQAVQLVRDEPIDLVVLDVRMPFMSGYETAKRIIQEGYNVPILFLSAKGLAREVDKGFNCGSVVVDYLVKPVSIDYFLSRVNEILHGCRERGMAALRQESLAQFVAVRERIRI